MALFTVTINLVILSFFSLGLAAEINEINFTDYKGFQDKWKLVTVRYRKDTNEQRFVYANSIAWKDFKKNNVKFSQGAVFAKMGISTADDPSFPSSVVPQKALRIQLMVKDLKKYKDTDGWGYAIFDGNGNRLPQEAKNTPTACHSCHKIVPERDFVFAQPMEFHMLKVASRDQNLIPDKIKFESLSVKDLPQAIRSLMPKKYNSIRNLVSAAQDKLFVGTVNEISPIMAKEVDRAQLPTILIQKDRNNFLMVLSNPESSMCSGLTPKRQAYKVIHNVNVDDSKTINRSEFCQ